MTTQAARGVAREELAKFRAWQGQWWSTTGPLRSLHLFNRVRANYINEMVQRYAGDETKMVPEHGGLTVQHKVLDVGCGGGILSEALARLGATVRGIDACAETISEAQRRQQALVAQAKEIYGVPLLPTRWESRLQYDQASVFDLAANVNKEEKNSEGYDVVVASEVVEHVDDARGFVEALCTITKPGGLLILSTMDKTWRTALSHIFIAEQLTGLVPPGTHDWAKFIPPASLTTFAARYGVHNVNLEYLLTYPDLYQSLVTGSLQVDMRRTTKVNTGHYLWTGRKSKAMNKKEDKLLLQYRFSMSTPFDQLGEPVQRLLRALPAGTVDEEDITLLLEHISVKDMAKIYSELATDRPAVDIWHDVHTELQDRQAHVARHDAELRARQRELDEQRREKADNTQSDNNNNDVDGAEEKGKGDVGEATSAQAEGQDRDTVTKEKDGALNAAQTSLDAARAEATPRQVCDQRKDWSDYVQRHPLQFANNTTSISGSNTVASSQSERRSVRRSCPDALLPASYPATSAIDEIAQKPLKHVLNIPYKMDKAVLQRTYTAKCPQCGTRFAHPPPQWSCPQCWRLHESRVKVWQPDESSRVCMLCGNFIGRWSRHHCRNCGRLTCSRCCEHRALIAALGYEEPEKVCDDCAKLCTTS